MVQLGSSLLNPMCSRLLPLKSATEWLGLTDWAMRERIWAGQIPIVRFPGGRKMYLDIQDLETLIHENKETIQSELGEKGFPA